MTITTEATYENGVLKPVRPLPLREQEKVEVVIRSAIPSESSTTVPIHERQAALRRLLSLELPVADWEQMEQEIIRGAVE